MRTATVSRQSVSQLTVSQTTMPPSMGKSQKVAASQQKCYRLTRRGRVVFTAVTALLITALGVGTGTAHAAGSSPSRGASSRGASSRYQVTVLAGENLWSLAEKLAPGADSRDLIAEIIGLNALSGTTIYPGERLWVPRE
jgi:hypothetical protein